MPTAQRWIDLFTAPLKALYSTPFYLQVLLARRGVGFTYLLFVSMLLAIPVTYKLGGMVEILKSYELSKLVAQVPPSYISPEGILTSKSNINYAEIQNSKGETIIVYNPDDLPLEGELLNAPLEIASHSLIVRVHNDDGSFHSSQSVPWSMIFESGGNFEPMQTAAAFEEACNAPLAAFYVGAIVYLVLYVILNWAIIALFGRLSMYFISGLRISFKDSLRLSAYANTLILILGALGFFMPVAFNSTLIFLLPVFYLILVGRYIRRAINRYGDKVFAKAVEICLKRDGLSRAPSPADYMQAKAILEGAQAQAQTAETAGSPGSSGPNDNSGSGGVFMP